MAFQMDLLDGEACVVYVNIVTIFSEFRVFGGDSLHRSLLHARGNTDHQWHDGQFEAMRVARTWKHSRPAKCSSLLR